MGFPAGQKLSESECGALASYFGFGEVWQDQHGTVYRSLKGSPDNPCGPRVGGRFVTDEQLNEWWDGGNKSKKA